MMRATLTTLLLLGAASLTGCGGCNSGKPATPAAKPAATTPAADTPPAAGAPTAATGAATTPAASEADCFVIVDAEPDFGAPPLTVHFTTETDCTGSPVTFSWDFGDGTKGENDPKPSHTYDKVGDYIAVVTATAPDGGNGTDEIDITVDEDQAE